MIKKLENSNEIIANRIQTVFQNSYNVEAQLIGALDFPHLLRSAKNIVNSTTDFYGFSENNCLAAIIEIEIKIKNKLLDIHSLTVDPKYFRKGIADKLINYVLKTFEISIVIVETAVKNKPAINLYEKHGFHEYKRWTPTHGIEKLAMTVKLAT
jgi:ribosomal protein S18 acetylase RimI-like enzyme